MSIIDHGVLGQVQHEFCLDEELVRLASKGDYAAFSQAIADKMPAAIESRNERNMQILNKLMGARGRQSWLDDLNGSHCTSGDMWSSAVRRMAEDAMLRIRDER